MELKEAIGIRRSIRYYQSWRPVEREKVQKMLEAARLASHWGNMNMTQAVVIENMPPRPEVIDAINTPGSPVHAAMAPVLIVWYINTAVRSEMADRLKELVDVGALNATHGWSHTFCEQFAARALGQRGAGNQPTGFDLIDAGQAIAQATLVAFEEGLGTCLNGLDVQKIRQLLDMPEWAVPIALMTVGYPAEAPQAGGQRPRRPFADIYHLNKFGQPFPRQPEVVQELEREGMIQAAAPLPWRREEVRALARTFGLPL